MIPCFRMRSAAILLIVLGGLGSAAHAQVPTVTFLSHDTAFVGSSPFQLAVNGTDFSDSSVVRVDGSDRVTTWDGNPTRVYADLLAADFDTAKALEIRVFNRGPGGGLSNPETLWVLAPAPDLSAISPDVVVAGDPGFTLTVTGSGFFPNSVVRIGGSDRTTTWVSALEMTAQILASDIASAGDFDITVFTPGPGGGESAPRTLTATTTNPVPVITQIDPDSIAQGSTGFTLTVTGSGFTSSSVVRWDGISRPTTFISPTEVTAAIADTQVVSAGGFPVTVFNPSPGGGTSNQVFFSVLAINPVPTTTVLVPDSMLVGASGFILSVNGTGFVDGASVVRFNGIDRVTTHIPGNPTRVFADILAGDVDTAGTFEVRVYNPPPGGGLSNATMFYVVNPPPTIDRINPTTVAEGEPGFSMTVVGSGFIDGSVVRIAGLDRATTFVDDTLVTALILASDIDTAGNFAVTVFNPAPGGGVSNINYLTVGAINPIPQLTSIDPTVLRPGNPTFTMTVTGLGFVPASVVRWGGSPLPTTFVSATELTAEVDSALLVPEGGLFPITVQNPSPGGGVSDSINFVDAPVPTVDHTVPDSVFVGIGQFILSVNGTGYVEGHSIVRFNGQDRVTTYIPGNPTRVFADIPAGDVDSAGIFQITVFNPGPGPGESNDTSFYVLNYVPQITRITPDTVATGGSDFTLTVFGSAFVNTSIVRFGGADRTTTFVSDTVLTALIPASDIDTSGSYTITVFSPAPGGGVSGGVTLAVVAGAPLPVLTSIDPQILRPGNPTFTMTLTGSGFIPSSVARWSGAPLPTTFVSATEVTAEVESFLLPTEGGRFPITVFNPSPGGGVSDSVDFIVSPVPTVNNTVPDSVFAGIGSFTLSVNGTGYVDGHSIVYFNGQPRVTSYIPSNPTRVFAEILASDVDTAGEFQITVLNAGPGPGLSNDTSFFVLNSLAEITRITPSAKTVGDTGFTMTVYGNGFLSGSVGQFRGSNRATTVINDTVLTMVLLTGDLDTAGTYDVTVLNPPPGGGPSLAAHFTVTSENLGPVLTLLSPPSAIVGGAGFTLTVFGSNFVGTSVVRISGQDRATTYIDNTGLQAQILASDIDTVGSYPITVFSPAPGGGTSLPIDLVVTQALTAANLKIFMQGPYVGGTMRTALLDSGFVPLTQPYGVPPWSYGGAEAVGSVPASVVDWVLVQVRSDTSAATTVATRAAFLMSDGRVVDTSGTGPVPFAGIPAGSYYVVVRHRNHLAVMSATALPLSASSALYDFTTGLDKYFGGDAREVATGVYGMWAGDCNANGQTRYMGSANDRSAIFVRIGGVSITDVVRGYFGEDVNLDGFVKYMGSANDRSAVFLGIGGGAITDVKSTHVPQ